MGEEIDRGNLHNKLMYGTVQSVNGNAFSGFENGFERSNVQSAFQYIMLYLGLLSQAYKENNQIRLIYQ